MDTLTRHEQRLVRQIAGASRCPVRVVPGDSPPRALGTRGYACFTSGTACRAPGAAIRAGYRVEWEPSTYRVEVGEVWVRRWRLERRLGQCKGLLSVILAHLALDTPDGIMADWLAERGHLAAARRLQPPLFPSPAGQAGKQKGLPQ